MWNKAVLSLILALVLIAAGALLPKIVGTIMDTSLSNRIEFADASDIQLEFVQSDMPMEEILGIMCKSTNSVEIPADLAVHSAEEIHQLALQAITHYQEANLIPHSIDADADIQSCIPKLHYQQSSSRKSNIFWNLIFEPSDNSWRLEMALDDRTGALCSINYDYRVVSVDPGYANTPEPIYADLEGMLLTFADVFLSGLGENFAELDTDEISAGISTSVDEDYASTTVSWADSIKGECHIVFYILDTSFYTIYY